MSLQWRIAVAVVLLVFAWKGSSLKIEWPPAGGGASVVVPKPEGVILEWAEPLRPILPKMLAKDREYLSNFYDALSFVLIRDSKRASPIVKTTGDFVIFHAGSLQLAIDKEAVGKYPGLGEAIDQTFVNALGADPRLLSADDRTKLTAACSVLAYALKVGNDG
jgi:hypothetical protein